MPFLFFGSGRGVVRPPEKHSLIENDRGRKVLRLARTEQVVDIHKGRSSDLDHVTFM